MQRAQKVHQSQNMQRAQENKSPKIHKGPLGMRQLDYTCEQYFAEWSSNLMECEEVKIIRRPVSLSPPKTPSPTPRLTRKTTPPKKKVNHFKFCLDEKIECFIIHLSVYLSLWFLTDVLERLLADFQDHSCPNLTLYGVPKMNLWQDIPKMVFTGEK